MTLLFAFAAFAAVAEAAPAPAQPQAKPAAEKKICKREEITGSRVSGKRVCRTEAQWDAIQQQSQQAIQEMTRLQKGASGN